VSINLGEDNNINIGEDNNKVVNEYNNFDSQTHIVILILKLRITRMKLQDKMILILKIYMIQVNGRIVIQY